MEAKAQQAKPDLADEFARLYWAEVDPEELAARAPSDLAGAAAAHLEFGRRFSERHAEDPRLQPGARAARLAEQRTRVIEIVNDDMPFLVDSVTMEVEPPGAHAAPRDPSGAAQRAQPRAAS